MSTRLTILCLNKTYFVKELRQAGHTVITASVPENQSLSQHEMTSQRQFDIAFSDNVDVETLLKKLPKLDRLVYYDDSNSSFYIEGLERSNVPTLFYSIDAHIHHRWHPSFSGVFDRVLVAQRDFIPHFQAFNQQTFWLPLWATAVHQPVTPKSIDVCFRGSLDKAHRPKRVNFLERLAKLVPVNARCEDYPDGFTRSKIILNELIGGDVNFRIFEAMACGGMLLTPESGNGLPDLFTPGVHLVTYRDDDAQDAAEKIRFYLANEEARARIATAGHAEVLKHHTAAARARQFEEHLVGTSVTGRPRRDFSAAFHLLMKTRLLRRMVRDQATHWMLKTADRLIGCSGKEPANPELVITAVNCAFLLHEYKRSDEAMYMLSRLSKAYPDQGALVVAMIDLMQKQGEFAKAKELAASVFADPDAALQQLPHMLQEIADPLKLES